VGAILAAATSSAGSTNEDKKPIITTSTTTSQSDAAMINAMLGMAGVGNTSDIFGLMDQPKSGGVTVKTEPTTKGYYILIN